MSSPERPDGPRRGQPNADPWQSPVWQATIIDLIQLAGDSVPPSLGREGLYEASFYSRSEDGLPVGGVLDHRANVDRPDHRLLVTLSRHRYESDHTGELWVSTTHYDIRNNDDGRSITRRREYGEYWDLEYGSTGRRPGLIRGLKVAIDRKQADTDPKRRPRPAIDPFVSQGEAHYMLERFKACKVFGAPENPAYWSGPRFNAGD